MDEPSHGDGTEGDRRSHDAVALENQMLRRRLRELEEGPARPRTRDTEQRENLVKLLEIKNRQLEQSFAQMERSHQELASAHRRTERYYVNTMLALVQVTEAKDPFFANHSRAVATCARGIARVLGWDAPRIEILEVAAHLHDFGNLGVPPEILRHPGPLSPVQRAQVQAHPMIARQLLEPIGPLGQALTWIEQHHERPDGTGYPRGLAGDAIAPEARVLHAAEAYVAMTSARPYRAALDRDQVQAQFRAGRGTQFDPAVLDALAGWERQGTQERGGGARGPGQEARQA